VGSVLHSPVTCAVHPGIGLHHQYKAFGHGQRERTVRVPTVVAAQQMACGGGQTQPQGVRVGMGACVCGWWRGQRVIRAISRAVRGQQRRRRGREKAGGLGGRYTGAGGSEVQRRDRGGRTAGMEEDATTCASTRAREVRVLRKVWRWTERTQGKARARFQTRVGAQQAPFEREDKPPRLE
jgi:hypothetical protein